MLSIFICLLCEHMFHITGSGDDDTIARYHYISFFPLLSRFRYMKTQTQPISIGMTEDRSSAMLADDLDKSDDNDENSFLITIFGRGPIKQ